MSDDKVLNSTVVRLGLVSLFADISSEMLYPITPIFLTTVLGASMASVGLIEGFAEAVASLLKVYSGAWSDRLSRRTPFVALGYFLSAIARPITGVSSSWLQVLLARGLDRTGKGLRTAPRDALLAEAVSDKNRGAAYGWHRGMDSMGAAIGPVVAIMYLSYSSGDLRSIYFWALIPGLIAVLISLRVRDPKRVPSTERKSLQFFDFKSFSPSFRAYLLSWTVFSLANSSDVFLLMKAKSTLGLIEVIWIYCAYNVVYAISSPYLGGLSDRIGRKSVMVAGLLVFAAVYLGFAQASERWHFWVLFMTYGLYIAATDGVGKALAVDLVDPKKKATGLGALGAVTGIATLFASSTAGLLWDHYGSTSTFMFGACGALLSSLLLLRVSSTPGPWRANCN